MARHTLLELAQLASADIIGDGALEIEGTASLAEASPSEISFCVHPRYASALAATRAGAVVVTPELAAGRPCANLLVHPAPNAAFTTISACFASERTRPAEGVHPSAVIEPGAVLGPGVAVGPLCVVAARARLGPRCVLHAGVLVGPGVELGEDCELFGHVVLYEGVRLGARCRVHAGAVLGADGFGYDPPARAGEPWTKIPHSGRVEIGDDVEIGANSTVDRGRFGATRIGQGAKLDNLVHVGHNVDIGARTMIAAQVGLAGSARIGSDVQFGGQSGAGGHLEIGDGAILAARCGVIGDVPAGEVWMGFPARPRSEALRNMALGARVRRLEERLKDMERSARLAAPEDLQEKGSR